MFTKDRSFYKTFFTLCGTLVLQNIIVLGVNLADNVMIGGYSEISLSGVAAVNQIQFILQQIVNAVGDVVPASIGARNAWIPFAGSPPSVCASAWRSLWCCSCW